MGVRWGLGVEAVSAIIFIIGENKSPAENTFNGQLGLWTVQILNPSSISTSFARSLLFPFCPSVGAFCRPFFPKLAFEGCGRSLLAGHMACQSEGTAPELRRGRWGFRARPSPAAPASPRPRGPAMAPPWSWARQPRRLRQWPSACSENRANRSHPVGSRCERSALPFGIMTRAATREMSLERGKMD